MSLASFVYDSNWDAPVFKLLPKNDTGDASGHQSGMVIPIALRKYFPQLENHISGTQPTVDLRIPVILCLNGSEVARVSTRYQMQTWGGTRRPETRLTDNLTPLLNHAKAGDYLLIQRNITLPHLYRLTIVSKTSDDYVELQRSVGNARWGVLGDITPVSDVEIEEAQLEEREREASTFELFELTARTSETRAVRIARSAVFKEMVSKAYSNKCAVTGESLRSPDGSYECEAAHIVPRSRLGADDVRNGLALTRRLHWAFDKGLFSFDEQRRVIVPDHISSIPENEPLANLSGTPLHEPPEIQHQAHRSALQWHRENVLSKHS